MTISQSIVLGTIEIVCLQQKKLLDRENYCHLSFFHNSFSITLKHGRHFLSLNNGFFFMLSTWLSLSLFLCGWKEKFQFRLIMKWIENVNVHFASHNRLKRALKFHFFFIFGWSMSLSHPFCRILNHRKVCRGNELKIMVAKHFSKLN